MTEHKIIIPIKPGQKTLNSNQRLHWAAKADLTRLWRNLGAWHAKSTKMPRFNYAAVNVDVYKPTKRKYDPMNLYPTFKAVCDGFTDAGAWEDDNMNHVDGPFIHHAGVDQENPRYEIIIKEVQS